MGSDIETETVKEGIKYFLYLDSLVEAEIGIQDISEEHNDDLGREDASSDSYQSDATIAAEIDDSGISLTFVDGGNGKAEEGHLGVNEKGEDGENANEATKNEPIPRRRWRKKPSPWPFLHLMEAKTGKKSSWTKTAHILRQTGSRARERMKTITPTEFRLALRPAKTRS